HDRDLVYPRHPAPGVRERCGRGRPARAGFYRAGRHAGGAAGRYTADPRLLCDRSEPARTGARSAAWKQITVTVATASAAYSRAQAVGLLLGPALFCVTLFMLEPEGLSFEGRTVLAVTLWVAVWWITEAIPIPATSLLPL